MDIPTTRQTAVTPRLVVSYNRYDGYYERGGSFSITLVQPPHVAINKKLFSINSRGSSRKATGDNATLVYFSIAANTSVTPSKAVITIESKREIITLEVAQTETNRNIHLCGMWEHHCRVGGVLLKSDEK